jgi:hypothetical protein
MWTPPGSSPPSRSLTACASTASSPVARPPPTGSLSPCSARGGRSFSGVDWGHQQWIWWGGRGGFWVLTALDAVLPPGKRRVGIGSDGAVPRRPGRRTARHFFGAALDSSSCTPPPGAADVRRSSSSRAPSPQPRQWLRPNVGVCAGTTTY